MGQAEGGRGPMGVRTRDGDTTAMQPAAQMNAREKGEEPKRRSSSGSSGGTQRSKNGSTGPHPHRRTAASRSPSPGSACRALHGGMTTGGGWRPRWPSHLQGWSGPSPWVAGWGMGPDPGLGHRIGPARSKTLSRPEQPNRDANATPGRLQ